MRKRIVFVLVMIFCLFLFASCSEREEELVPITVTFNTNGGSLVSPVTDKTISVLPDSVRDGYILEGWYEQENFAGKRVSFPYKAPSTCVLYAKWIDKDKGNEELIFSKTEDGLSYKVVGCTTSCPTIWIPDKYDNLPVIALEKNCLKTKGLVTLIHIGKYVEEINESFSRCALLEKFDIENGGAFHVSDGVLYNAEGTVLIAYPVNKQQEEFVIGDNVAEIKEDAFTFADNLKSLIIGKSYCSQGKCFSLMSGLKSISVHEQNKYYKSVNGVLYSKNGDTLFVYPSKYSIQEYTVEKGTKTIEGDAFSNSNVVTIRLAKETEEFSLSEETPYLISFSVEEGNEVFTAKNGVLFIDGGKTLFRFPQGKAGQYTVPSGTEKIYDFAFRASCVTDLTLSKDIKTINAYAFSFCKDLVKVTFEEDSLLEEISESAFNGCSSLQKVSFTSRIPPETGAYIFSSCNESVKVVVPMNLEEYYKYRWSYCASKIVASGLSVIPYIVSFVAEGENISPKEVAFILQEPVLSKEDSREVIGQENGHNVVNVEKYIFLGWYENSEGTGEKIEFPYAVTHSITLYAVWELSWETVME